MKASLVAKSVLYEIQGRRFFLLLLNTTSSLKSGYFYLLVVSRDDNSSSSASSELTSSWFLDLYFNKLDLNSSALLELDDNCQVKNTVLFPRDLKVPLNLFLPGKTRLEPSLTDADTSSAGTLELVFDNLLSDRMGPIQDDHCAPASSFYSSADVVNYEGVVTKIIDPVFKLYQMDNASDVILCLNYYPRESAKSNENCALPLNIIPGKTVLSLFNVHGITRNGIIYLVPCCFSLIDIDVVSRDRKCEDVSYFTGFGEEDWLCCLGFKLFLEFYESYLYRFQLSQPSWLAVNQPWLESLETFEAGKGKYDVMSRILRRVYFSLLNKKHSSASASTLLQERNIYKEFFYHGRQSFSCILHPSGDENENPEAEGTSSKFTRLKSIVDLKRLLQSRANEFYGLELRDTESSSMSSKDFSIGQSGFPSSQFFTQNGDDKRLLGETFLISYQQEESSKRSKKSRIEGKDEEEGEESFLIMGVLRRDYDANGGSFYYFEDGTGKMRINGGGDLSGYLDCLVMLETGKFDLAVDVLPNLKAASQDDDNPFSRLEFSLLPYLLLGSSSSSLSGSVIARIGSKKFDSRCKMLKASQHQKCIFKINSLGEHPIFIHRVISNKGICLGSMRHPSAANRPLFEVQIAIPSDLDRKMEGNAFSINAPLEVLQMFHGQKRKSKTINESAVSSSTSDVSACLDDWDNLEALSDPNHFYKANLIFARIDENDAKKQVFTPVVNIASDSESNEMLESTRMALLSQWQSVRQCLTTRSKNRKKAYRSSPSSSSSSCFTGYEKIPVLYGRFVSKSFVLELGSSTGETTAAGGAWLKVTLADFDDDFGSYVVVWIKLGWKKCLPGLFKLANENSSLILVLRNVLLYQGRKGANSPGNESINGRFYLLDPSPDNIEFLEIKKNNVKSLLMTYYSHWFRSPEPLEVLIDKAISTFGLENMESSQDADSSIALITLQQVFRDYTEAVLRGDAKAKKPINRTLHGSLTRLDRIYLCLGDDEKQTLHIKVEGFFSDGTGEVRLFIFDDLPAFGSDSAAGDFKLELKSEFNNNNSSNSAARGPAFRIEVFFPTLSHDQRKQLEAHLKCILGKRSDHSFLYQHHHISNANSTSARKGIQMLMNDLLKCATSRSTSSSNSHQFLDYFCQALFYQCVTCQLPLELELSLRVKALSSNWSNSAINGGGSGGKSSRTCMVKLNDSGSSSGGYYNHHYIETLSPLLLLGSSRIYSIGKAAVKDDEISQLELQYGLQIK